jgi:hypothetical protein
MCVHACILFLCFIKGLEVQAEPIIIAHLMLLCATFVLHGKEFAHTYYCTSSRIKKHPSHQTRLSFLVTPAACSTSRRAESIMEGCAFKVVSKTKMFMLHYLNICSLQFILNVIFLSELDNTT